MGNTLQRLSVQYDEEKALVFDPFQLTEVKVIKEYITEQDYGIYRCNILYQRC